MSEPSVFAFPVSAIFAAALLLGIYMVFRAKGRIYQILSAWEITVAAMVIVAVLNAVEGTWKLSLQHNVFFIALMLLLMFPLGLTVLDSFVQKKRISFILCHLGFFLIIFGTFWSACDYRSAIMDVNKVDDRYLAVNESDGFPTPLPFRVRLQEFRADYYDDGVSPRQYSSTIVIDGKTMTTEVNSPCFYKSWFIYQYNFDKNDANVSVLKFVRDSWLPVTLLGMLLLAAGAVLGLGSIWQTRWMLPVTIVLAAAFTAISVARINFGTLMPALRSLWFVPHLIVYMLAYSLLAIALALGTVSLVKKNADGLNRISTQLLGTSSSLLIIGMLCGAVWAKFAWGDYWTWDAKECWAAATWLLTLAGTHFFGKERTKVIVLMILLAFLAMQITWYGVNWLPSAQFSMHTYR